MNPQDLKKAIEKKRNPEGYLMAALEEMQIQVADMIEKVNEALSTIEKESKKINQDEIIKTVSENVSKKVPDLASLTQSVVAEVKKIMPEDGKTPVKGVDYFDGTDGDTPEIDIEEIARLAAPMVHVPVAGVDFELPNYEEETKETIAEKLGIDLPFLKNLKKTIDTMNKNIRSISRSKSTSKPFMRGGGDIILAGAGIGVTQTNGHGRKTITNLNTGGFTVLAATETPNGATTVFTFLSATAQPSYLLIDTAWVRATDAAGNVNWTWNSGTKKATLLVPPPNAEILAVV